MISSILIKTKRKEGFTLIELLVVIAIIGTLSTIGFIALTQSQQGADDATKVTEMQVLRSAITINYVSQDGLPNITRGSNVSGTLPTTVVCELANVSGSLGTVLADGVENIDWSKFYYCANDGGSTSGTPVADSTRAVIATVEQIDSGHAIFNGASSLNIAAVSGSSAVDCATVTSDKRTLCFEINK